MKNKNNTNQIILDNKYLVIEKLGSGATANVYKVKDLNSNKIYAAKIFKKSTYLDKETNMLKLINNPSIINLVSTGEGQISKNGKLSSIKKYIILDFAEKGTLFDYIFLPKKGFGEKYAKVIFRKILNGVLSCHEKGVCHRDIKLENVLLDSKFNPKICDFGFATLIQGKEGNGILRTPLGTTSYAAPEILLNKGYNGIKADTFSLGPLLLIIVTGKIGFIQARRKDPFYRYIMARDYNEYWNRVSDQLPETSKEFKNLFIKMVCFDPKRRISIEEILETDPWLNEIRELNNEQLAELEREIYNEFLKREKIVLLNSSESIQAESQNDDENDEATKGVGDDDYFSLDLKLKYEKTGLNMKDYVKIEGEITPYKFMNDLANMIKKDNDCSIEADKKTYKFLVDFEIKEEEDEENIPEELLEKLKGIEEEDEAEKGEDEDEDDDEVKKINSIIQVKLFKSCDSGYLIRFMKKSGEMDEFYKNVNKIKEAIKRIV